MKLSYRGAQYEVNLSQGQSNGVDIVGTYRGAPATWRHVHHQNNQQHQVEMTYRGVKYNRPL